ncbi:hypothetical protein PLICRDRAFT_179247 [Plicaturopsis crispa FD-325 SS-3]|uniref:Unplaced genomic scaffold PLICRscaffold_16, whole genome shotgun sequence n=1 Tax=Plicaturopsis crispa FD-325 SS-3 TaxID=944288 RepID=A0A0C9SRQ3_PLICR|nr:hypothetical protein PLICRDRAFT_179247 [Plicaturopsis crispa FD-325 SS-3]
MRVDFFAFQRVWSKPMRALVREKSGVTATKKVFASHDALSTTKYSPTAAKQDFHLRPPFGIRFGPNPSVMSMSRKYRSRCRAPNAIAQVTKRGYSPATVRPSRILRARITHSLSVRPVSQVDCTPNKRTMQCNICPGSPLQNWANHHPSASFISDASRAILHAPSSRDAAAARGGCRASKMSDAYAERL